MYHHVYAEFIQFKFPLKYYKKVSVLQKYEEFLTTIMVFIFIDTRAHCLYTMMKRI